MIDGRKSNLPDKISLDYYDDYMHIRKTWFGIGTIFQSIFALIWVGGMLFGMSFAIRGAGTEVGLVRWLIPIVMAGIVIYVSYSILANWFNKTDIFVSQSLMEIKIGPVPWVGNQRLKVENIARFYSKIRLSGKKRHKTAHYELRFVTHKGKDKSLIDDIETIEAAEFIEREITQYLGMVSVKIN